jgi:hypothetical protein
MLDPRARRPAGKLTLLAGAMVLALVGAWLLFTGIDWLRDGCDCDEPLARDWYWVPLVALGAASVAGAIALVWRALRR